MSGPVAVLLPGNRLHLQHGPIDLIIGVEGSPAEVTAAYQAAQARFTPILGQLMQEIDLLRCSKGPKPKGLIAKHMWQAVRSHTGFITPMAAVAGSVADVILFAMQDAAPQIKRAYVNNGGDIALVLSKNAGFETAILHESGANLGRISIKAKDPTRGIATSGRGGRSLSLGIADSVTVLAATAAKADAAATLIANSIDLPDHAGILRATADDVSPGSDLGQNLIPISIPALAAVERKAALLAGHRRAVAMQNAGQIHAASLFLQGETLHVHPNMKLQSNEGNPVYA